MFGGECILRGSLRTMSPTVSVIIPNYNYARYLEQGFETNQAVIHGLRNHFW